MCLPKICSPLSIPNSRDPRLKHHARVPAMANNISASETGQKWKLKQDFSFVAANPLKRLKRTPAIPPSSHRDYSQAPHLGK